MTFSPQPPYGTVYMQGTRSLYEMAMNARQLSYQENYSYTEGWNDNTVAEIFNLGLNQLYDAVTQVDSPANIEEYTQDVFAGIMEYPVPQNVKMALQIMNVRYLYGPETWQFVTLEEGQIQDRFSYPTNIPTTWCLRNGKILLSPTPNITRERSLIVNYQKRMRKIDFRRGKVGSLVSSYGNITNISNASPAEVTTAAPHGLSSNTKVGISGVFTMPNLVDRSFIITVTGTNTFTLNGTDTSIDPIYSGVAVWFKNPVQFQLNFTVTSQKDANMQANANSLLDKIQWICLTGVNGEPVVDAIAVASYNMTTFILTCDSNYVMPYDAWTALNAVWANQDQPYVIQGDYSSTHSQLDRQSEDLLIEYCVLRLLRLQSAAEPTADQLQAEEAVLNRLRIAYRRWRPSIVPIVYQQRLRTRSWFWGGRGPY